VITVTNGSTNRLRLARAALLARHDSGALAPAIYSTIRELETEISWREHAQHRRLACEGE